MTLNITLVHPECVYVAADFRLAHVRNGTAVPITEPSMKVVRFESSKCRGMITYTGIGRDGKNKDTALHVVDWLTDVQGADFEDIADVIRHNANRWMRSTVAVPQYHTFVLAGYGREGASKLGLVSNFESLHARSLESAALDFNSTISKTTGHTLARVTGLSNAVPKERIKSLRRTVDADALDSAFVRNVMIGLIERAGSSSQFGNLISAEANAISLRPDGSGQHELSQPLNVESYLVDNGSVVPSTRSLLRNLGFGDRPLRAASFATSTSNSNFDHTRCRRAVYPGTGPKMYDLTELSLPGKPPFRAMAITDDGAVLASSTRDDGPFSSYWVWRGEDKIELVPTGADNPVLVAAGGIDAHGRIYLATGGLGVPEGIIRLQGVNSMALALPRAAVDLPITLSNVAPTGWLSGTAEVINDNTRADRSKPARWSPTGTLEVNTEVYQGFGGLARSIASDGTAVTWLHRNDLQIRSYLWSPDGTMTRLTIPPQGFATGITDSHEVVGIRTNGPERQAVRLTDGSTWVPLGPPPGWEPTHVSHTGLVAGHFQREGFRSAWVQDKGSSQTTLPGYHHHHHYVLASSPSGWLVGTATTDRCSHALLWTPRT